MLATVKLVMVVRLLQTITRLTFKPCTVSQLLNASAKPESEGWVKILRWPNSSAFNIRPARANLGEAAHENRTSATGWPTTDGLIGEPAITAKSSSDRKSTRLNSSHQCATRMQSSA